MFRSCQIIMRELCCSLLRLYYIIHNLIYIIIYETGSKLLCSSPCKFLHILVAAPSELYSQTLFFDYRLALNGASLLNVRAEFLCFVKFHQLHMFRRLICV